MLTRVVLIVSLLVASVHADDQSHPEHQVRSGVHDKRYGERGLHGDVHLVGFQGQPYTVPTESGSIYNIITMPSLYLNARMQDMTTAQHCVAEATTVEMPARSERECLSYPGTYMTSLGLVSGDDHIVIDATPRGDALNVTINGAVYVWSQLTIAVGNGTAELDRSLQVLTFTTRDLRITVRNVDRYVNVNIDVLNTKWLSAGRRSAIARNVDSRYANDVAASKLSTPMHGLLGQSINYVIYPGGAVYRGPSSDYMVKSLTSHQFYHSLYNPDAGNAHIEYP